MKVALVSLPWAEVKRPSASLGALAAFVRREEPSISVNCFYEYVHVAMTLGEELYRGIAGFSAVDIGELLYACLLYPEKREETKKATAKVLAKKFEGESPVRFGKEFQTWEDVLESVLFRLEEHAAQFAEELKSFDVVGLTTCHGQLFANLVLSRLLKRISPQAKIIFGGSTISGRVGPSLFQEYEFVDYVIQGEGELPLLELLRELKKSSTPSIQIKAVLTPSNAAVFPSGTALWEVKSLDDLPNPDFDEYMTLATQFGLDWRIPIEGSRGCWWDRTKSTGDPTKICYFCNLNVQWNGYRQKTEARIGREMAELSHRYKNTYFYFLDNIVRHKGVLDLAAQIQSRSSDFQIFYEMRANIKPYELLKMWEVGLEAVQFGIEGLSSAYLKRIGKGTSTIRNLQAMKLCYELGIRHSGNLITNFPSSTAEEVRETVKNLIDFAICYQPLNITQFFLGMGGTLDSLRKEFGIFNVRNSDHYKSAVPTSVLERVNLFELSFDAEAQSANWDAVYEAQNKWEQFQSQMKKLGTHALYYQDGHSYMNITDNRANPAQIVLENFQRDIYLYCTEIRSLREIKARFCEDTGLSVEDIRLFLQALVEKKLMFEENESYLSLAVAITPHAAARRISAEHKREIPVCSP